MSYPGPEQRFVGTVHHPTQVVGASHSTSVRRSPQGVTRIHRDHVDTYQPPPTPVYRDLITVPLTSSYTVHLPAPITEEHIENHTITRTGVRPVEHTVEYPTETTVLQPTVVHGVGHRVVEVPVKKIVPGVEHHLVHHMIEVPVNRVEDDVEYHVVEEPTTTIEHRPVVVHGTEQRTHVDQVPYTYQESIPATVTTTGTTYNPVNVMRTTHQYM